MDIETALEILDEEYAAGKISGEEYFDALIDGIPWPSDEVALEARQGKGSAATESMKNEEPSL